MSQTADRTLVILDLVASSAEALGLMEIAEAVHLDKSVVARILASLTGSGFLQRSEATRRYSAGARLVALSINVIRRSGLGGIVGKVVRELRDLTGETVSVHVRVGRARVCVDGAESTLAVRRGLVLGDVVPLYAGPTGKAIAAFLDEPDLREVMDEAEQAGVDLDQLRGLLVGVRRHGYLAVNGDRTPGVGAMSAPLFDKKGITASITIAGPSERWSLARMKDYTGALLTAAREVTRDLGGRFPIAEPEGIQPVGSRT